MTTQLNQLQLLETKFADYYEHRHIEQAANGVFMSALREGVDVETLLGLIEGGEALDALFFEATRGNVFDFIAPELKEVAKRLLDICPGGNGGMASVGRGEFAIAFLSDFAAKPSKAGKGDLEIGTSFEEVKLNSGKIEPNNDAGSVIWKRMQKLLADSDLKLKAADFVPFRKADREKLYDSAYLAKLNAIFWQAVTGEVNESLTDTELKAVWLKSSFKHTLSVSNSVLVMNNDGEFVRFTSVEQAVEYYSDRLDTVKVEFRANKGNKAGVYLNV